jgi:hypothetical protein
MLKIKGHFNEFIINELRKSKKTKKIKKMDEDMCSSCSLIKSLWSLKDHCSGQNVRNKTVDDLNGDGSDQNEKL